MEKTIAQKTNHDFNNGPFIIYENGNETYYESKSGYWEKREFDTNNNVIYYEDANGYWESRDFDKYNNVIYYENSNKYWEKREFDKYEMIRCENSEGIINK